jgi:hypothetical protein
MENRQQNPLQKYFRQPKIYVRLPSSGNFYPPGSLEKTENGEYPVYSMTAKDEIIIKTPDALLNGQATVDVIQSCVPNIKNAWNIPSIDLDALLVAIRIATYGELLDITTALPNTTETRTYEADLRTVLDRLLNATFDTEVKINEELTVFLRPLSYQEFTKNNIRTVEEQRIIRLVNDDKMEEDEKLARFADSFRKLTEVTIGMISQGIQRISTPDGDVVDQIFIQEFVNNSEKEILTTIINHLDLQRKKFTIEPFRVQTTKEEQELGAPDKFEVPITLDSSNFFA